jgi:N-acetylglutamate synthase-like GNAT family acetyltransferase
VQTLVAHPHMSRVERVYLMTTHQQGFYQRIGFEENASTTMVLYSNAGVEMLPALSEPGEIAVG